ncbi:MAG: DMT family transporter [Acidobacteriota bacterium]|nr:DMT family transporter [Acidobacteriota bacterium]MDH3524583.1 DMT family transporter [Acidobacteriota bacterium]
MSRGGASHRRAVLQALFVTFLWSTSWVLIKIGLREIPALGFAGLRYGLAFLMLLPVVLRRPDLRAALAGLERADWLRLGALGLVFYLATQGAQFVALAHLPAVAVSLALSLTPAVVAFGGVPLLGERPAGTQWLGLALALGGAALYFLPVTVPLHPIGLAAAGVGLLANAGGTLLGRGVNRERRLHPLVVTVVSMGVGAAGLVLAGLATEGAPRLGPAGWLIVLWLAAVNTAFAFTLWNRTLERLSATESSVLNNTMLVQIAVLAWLFLGESLAARQVAGILLAGVGALLVQLGSGRAKIPDREPPGGDEAPGS